MKTPLGRSLDALVFDFYATLAHAPDFSFAHGIDELLRGLEVDRGCFMAAYRRQLERYWEELASRGEEQHNSVWVAAALSECGRPSEPSDPWVRSAVDAYFDRYAGELRLFPDTAATLEELARHFPLALFSNFTDPRPVRRVLAREGVERHFRHIAISAEIGRRKPHPRVFAHVVEKLGTAPARTLYVGDDLHDDVGGARGAGLKTAWLRDREHSAVAREFRAGREAPGGAPPDLVLDRLLDLVGLLLA